LLLNDRAGAVARIGELLKVAPQVRPFVANHPWLKPLRGDPSFDALIRPAR
jgi:hypothetical protein